MHASPAHSSGLTRRLGLIAGPVVAAGAYLVLPKEYRDGAGDLVPFTAAGRATLAVMAWMAVWWLTEAIDLAATALLPLVAFPTLGVREIGAAAAPYANPLIFLFFGGFVLALAMQRWGLDRRLALYTLERVGPRPRNLIGGFMAATAFLSMFVSNTATVAMMLPIGISVIALVDPAASATGTSSRDDTFATPLMLGIAYAASIGGIGTIIGTPPNALLIGFLRDTIAPVFRTEISFAGWMMVGLPLVAIFLPLVWFLLTRVLFRVANEPIEGGRAFFAGELSRLGPATRAEWTTAAVFVFTATAWILRPLLVRLPWPGAGRPLAGISDAGIAMTAALLLFVLPVERRQRRFAMDWQSAKQLPWGILLLFGGGLSLASAIQEHGVADCIGSAVAAMPPLPAVAIVLAVATLVIFLTEMTSNTATTATLLPILAAVAPGLGVHPYLLVVPAAIAASCAFMMPVATPPNAIVFGSGRVPLRRMVRTGLWLNLIGIVLITVLTMLVVRPLWLATG